MTQTTKLTLGHALVYTFIVFKYVKLILWKEKYILVRIGLYFRYIGSPSWENLNEFWEQKQNTFRETWNFQGFGEINALFLGSQGAQTPLGGYF